MTLRCCTICTRTIDNPTVDCMRCNPDTDWVEIPSKTLAIYRLVRLSLQPVVTTLGRGLNALRRRLWVIQYRWRLRKARRCKRALDV